MVYIYRKNRWGIKEGFTGNGVLKKIISKLFARENLDDKVGLFLNKALEKGKLNVKPSYPKSYGGAYREIEVGEIQEEYGESGEKYLLVKAYYIEGVQDLGDGESEERSMELDVYIKVKENENDWMIISEEEARKDEVYI